MGIKNNPCKFSINWFNPTYNGSYERNIIRFIIRYFHMALLQKFKASNVIFFNYHEFLIHRKWVLNVIYKSWLNI